MKPLKKLLGAAVVIHWNDNSQQIEINPPGTGTRELSPELEQFIVDSISFRTPGAKVPAPDDDLAQSGVLIRYTGF